MIQAIHGFGRMWVSKYGRLDVLSKASYLFFFFIFLMVLSSGTVLCAAKNVPDKPLTIYIHESLYQSQNGALEALCDFPIRIKTFSGADLLAILTREGGATTGDIVIGLEGEQVGQEALRSMALELPESLFQKLSLPFDWSTKKFLPISYSYVAFLSKRDQDQKAFDGVAAFLKSIPAKSLVVSDPRSSMSGRAVLMWIDPSLDGLLGQKVMTYPKGWSGCFELFKRGKAPYILGYNLSEIYHRSKGQQDVRVVLFQKESHPLQVMTAFVVCKKTLHPKALALMTILLSDPFQRELMKSYSYPVTALPLPVAFETLRPPHAFVLGAFDERRLIQWMQAGYHQP